MYLTLVLVCIDELSSVTSYLGLRRTRIFLRSIQCDLDVLDFGIENGVEVTR